jgi:hypothetical protein
MTNAGRFRIAQSASVIVSAAAARCAGYVIFGGIIQHGQLVFDLHLESSGPESMIKKIAQFFTRPKYLLHC